MINIQKIKELEPTKRFELAKQCGFFVGTTNLSDEEKHYLDNYYHHCHDNRSPYITVGDNEDGRGWILVTFPTNVDEEFLAECSEVFTNYGGTLVREGVGGLSSLLEIDIISSGIDDILILWESRIKLASLHTINSYIN